jgi:hypothetical protein
VTPEQLGRVGEHLVAHWLSHFKPVERVWVNVDDPYHGFADVRYVVGLREYTIQVKSKSSWTQRRAAWTCARTNQRGYPRREHGFETARLERYIAAGCFCVIVESDGTMYELDLSDLDTSGVRYGCHTDCPGRFDHEWYECDWFAYFDRDRLTPLPWNCDCTVANAPQSDK